MKNRQKMSSLNLTPRNRIINQMNISMVSYMLFSNYRISFFNFSEGSSETLVGFILVLVIVLIILALALGFKFLIFDLFNIAGPGIDF